MNLTDAAHAIIAAGRYLDQRGWAPATSGNYSARLDDGRIAMTVSGRHKGELTGSDVMVLDAAGKPLDERKPSAETLLHTLLYRLFPDTNAVLHTHSVTGVTLTLLIHPNIAGIGFQQQEMLKAFPGVTTHDMAVEIPVFKNTQDMAALAAEVEQRLKEKSAPAFLIRGHGLYGWGKDMAEARRVIEATEFLLEYEYKTLLLTQEMRKTA